ncbi:hypothetical protein BGZ51_008458 [Haplosporangium sp. Z 767]|nr:hypothetical protein BGZ50_008687 [Haplosporangium sp. Z 11]KAF9177698.1 hypothetical protein BGZ51_008458 [Haplosporangium sp. Z 767]
MISRSFALTPISSGTEGLASATTPTLATRPTFMEQSKYNGLLTVNSEDINPNYAEYPSSTVRTPLTLQFSSVRGLSSPNIPSPITTSSQSIVSPPGPLSNFPLLNSLRSRKSHQQLESQQQEHSQATSTVRSNRRLSRVFDFASGNKQKHETSDSKVSTLESSRLQLSTDAMMALGLGTQLGSAGSMTAHNNGYDRLGYGLNQTGSGLGDGSLASIKSPLAIKSSPSLTSVTLPSLTSGADQLSTGSTAAGVAGTSGTSLPRIKTSFARSFSPLPNHVTESLRRSSISSATERTGQNIDKSTETGEDDDRSTTTGRGELRQRNNNHVKGKARDVESEAQKFSQELTWQQKLYHQKQHQQK